MFYITVPTTSVANVSYFYGFQIYENKQNTVYVGVFNKIIRTLKDLIDCISYEIYYRDTDVVWWKLRTARKRLKSNCGVLQEFLKILRLQASCRLFKSNIAVLSFRSSTKTSPFLYHSSRRESLKRFWNYFFTKIFLLLNLLDTSLNINCALLDDKRYFKSKVFKKKVCEK